MSKIVLTENGVQETAKSIMNAVADKYIELKEGSNDASNIVDDILGDNLDKMKEEILDAKEETQEEKEEKVSLLIKFRNAIKALDKKVYNPKAIAIGLLYRREGALENAKNDTALRIINGISDVFNLTIDCLFVTFKTVVELLSYILKTLMSCALGFVRYVVNKILKVQAIAN